MNTLRSILRDLALVTYAVAGVFLCIFLFRATKSLDGVNTALATVNHSCAPGPCGTLADVNKFAVDSRDAIVTTQQQELAVTKQIRLVLDALAGVPSHVNGTMDALSETATTASRSVQNLSDGLIPVLGHLDATAVDSDAVIKRLVPVEDDTDRLVRDFDDRVTSPELDRIQSNVQVITSNIATTTDTANHMLKTADQVETKLTQCTLHPTFWCSFKSDVIFGAQVGGYLLH